MDRIYLSLLARLMDFHWTLTNARRPMASTLRLKRKSGFGTPHGSSPNRIPHVCVGTEGGRISAVGPSATSQGYAVRSASGGEAVLETMFSAELCLLRESFDFSRQPLRRPHCR